MSIFITSMCAEGLMLIPPESNVIALPINPTVPLFFADLGVHFNTIIRGLCSEPWPTAIIPPIFFCLSCFSSNTVHDSPGNPAAIFFASAASFSGYITLGGRLASVRARFCTCPITEPISAPLLSLRTAAALLSINSTLSDSLLPFFLFVINSSYI